MKIWSSRLLEKEFAEGKLSEWKKTKYLMLPIILSSLLAGPIYLVTPNYGTSFPPINIIFALISNIIIAFVTFFGIRMVYRANKKIDGERFVERFIILSVPIYIKFIVFSLPVFFVLMLLFIRTLNMRDIFPLFLRVIFPFVMFWFYYLIFKSIKRFGTHLELINYNKQDITANDSPSC